MLMQRDTLRQRPSNRIIRRMAHTQFGPTMRSNTGSDTLVSKDKLTIIKDGPNRRIGQSPNRSSNGTTVPSDSSKINTGAIAGGGVVGGVVALMLIALMIWLLRRKRKRKSASQASATEVVSHDQDKSEIEVANHGQGKAELEVDDPSRMMADGLPRYELVGKDRPQEAGSAPIHELQASSIYHTVNH